MNRWSKAVAERLKPAVRAMEQIPDLGPMFQDCFLNTLETTLRHNAQGEPFIITGDIPAMWLRDSSAQVMHYVRFAEDEDIAGLLRGIIAAQMRQIGIDPYANAFNMNAQDVSVHHDLPPYGAWIWERKFEVDSLCAPLYLAHAFYQKTGDQRMLTPEFHRALCAVVHTFQVEQRHDGSPYWFVRQHCPASDTLENGGRGTAVGYTGMVWSGFRPSDDACRYGYLIPANLMAAKAMEYLASFARLMNDLTLAEQAEKLRSEILQGVERYGVMEHPGFGRIYAYETDGLGHHHLMDDANVPSLLSLPYLHAAETGDTLYQQTRAFVLSRENPYYYMGTAAKGIGSPHTPENHIWPIVLCMQGMTSVDIAEKRSALRMLLHTHADTFRMHESFHCDRPESYTRGWFAWANSLFAEMMMQLYETGELEQVLSGL